MSTYIAVLKAESLHGFIVSSPERRENNIYALRSKVGQDWLVRPYFRFYVKTSLNLFKCLLLFCPDFMRFNGRHILELG